MVSSNADGETDFFACVNLQFLGGDILISYADVFGTIVTKVVFVAMNRASLGCMIYNFAKMIDQMKNKLL